jgi:hypothetical protein
MTKIKSKWEKEYCEKFGLCPIEGNCQCSKELKFIKTLLAERERKVQQDINFVLTMVQGKTSREEIANFIKEYLISKENEN